MKRREGCIEIDHQLCILPDSAARRIMVFRCLGVLDNSLGVCGLWFLWINYHRPLCICKALQDRKNQYNNSI